MFYKNKYTGYEGNLWKFYVRNALAGLRFIAPINLLYYLSFNLSYAQIGLIELAASITILVLEVPTGIFADLLGRKRSMLISYFISTTAFLIMSFGGSLTAFMIGWAFSGAADAFESGADDALLFDTLKKIDRSDDYLKIKSRFILVSTVTIILGSITGAYLYTINKRLPWILYTGCIAVSGFIYASVKEPQLLEKNSTESKPLENFKTSLKLSLINKNVMWLILFCIILELPMFSFATLMSQPYLLNRGFGIASIGFVFAIIRGCSGLFSSLSHKLEKKLGEKKSFLMVPLLFVVLFTSAGILKSKGVILIVIALYTLANYKGIIINNYINHNIDSSSRATVLSIQSFIDNIVKTTLIVFIGHLADLYSIDVVLIFLGISMGLLSIPFLVLRYSKIFSNKKFITKAENSIE